MTYDATIFGLIVADVLGVPMDLRRPPAAGGLAMLDSLTLHPGGNVSNVATAMARLGMRAAAAGLVGDDVLGSAVVEQLRSAKVDVSSVRRKPGGQSCATIVAVEPGGERAFYYTSGVTSDLKPPVFRDCFPIFRESRFVQVGYFGLLPGLTAELPELLAELKREAPDTKLALDTVNPPAQADLLWPILPHLDVFAPSRTEAAALTGETDPRKMVAAFRAYMPAGLIGIKLDREGCLLDDGKTSVIIPAAKVEVVDTTGAGDTWFGALMCALIKNMSLEQAGRFANRAAADCCSAVGASAGVRSFEQTLARL